jgi:hypothetical protein
MTSIKSNPTFRVIPGAKYILVSSDKRMEIINKINRKEYPFKMASLRGITRENNILHANKWWQKKCHPEKDIPRKICSIVDLLQGDTIDDLYSRYATHFASDCVERTIFQNYSRELIRQGMLIELL